MTKKIDLNQIPEDWIELTGDGKIIINNSDFTEEVKKALDEAQFGDQKIARNGGCNCPTT